MRPFSKREVAEFYRRLAASRPIPQTELEFINPFTLLVAVVLSAQATDVGVNKATPALFAIADTPVKMLALGEEKLAGMIRTIGLYRTKARKPDCPVCVVVDLCRYGAKTAPAEMIAARAEAITPAPLAEPRVSRPPARRARRR